MISFSNEKAQDLHRVIVLHPILPDRSFVTTTRTTERTNCSSQIIRYYNEDDGTYELDIKQRALADRVRVRSPSEAMKEIEQSPARSANMIMPPTSRPPAAGAPHANLIREEAAHAVPGRLVNPFGGPLGGASNQHRAGSAPSNQIGPPPRSGTMLGKEQYGDSSGSRAARGGVAEEPSRSQNSPSKDRATVVVEGAGEVDSKGGAPPPGAVGAPPPAPGSLRSAIINKDPAAHRRGSQMVEDLELQRYFNASGALRPGTNCSYHETEYSPGERAVVDAIANEDFLLITVNGEQEKRVAASTVGICWLSPLDLD